MAQSSYLLLPVCVIMDLPTVGARAVFPSPQIAVTVFMHLSPLSPPPPWWAQWGYPWTWGCTWWQMLWIAGTDTFHSGTKI